MAVSNLNRASRLGRRGGRQEGVDGRGSDRAESAARVEGGGVVSNGEERDLDLGRVGGVTAAWARRGRAGEAAGCEGDGRQTFK